MKTLKRIIYTTLMILLTMSFSNCSSAQKLQEQTPFTIDDVYSQGWIAGVEGGGSGVNVFITIGELGKKIEMEGLYFNDQYVKLEKNKGNGNLFIGRIKTAANQKKELILQQDAKKESEKEVSATVKKEKIPFELEKDQAVITYKQNGALKYFKIEDIKSKAPLAYPSAPKNATGQLIKQ
ncbi:hypothetical protein GTQ40_11845 [Flavobacteriaceae bacterium R38]|nr:hypothetical protein [Flavobacteriaceae bacterium R38]